MACCRVVACVVMAWAALALAAEVPEFAPKITEVTVFKDGHAFILARGQAKLADGWCRTRHVPAAVLGAFWGFAADPDCEVDVLRAGTVATESTRPCLTLDEMIQANKGKRVTLVEQAPGAAQGNAVTHEGTLLGFLQHEGTREEMGTKTVPGGYDPSGRYVQPETVTELRDEKVKALSAFVLIETPTGVTLVKRENIRSLAIADKKPATTTVEPKEVREIACHVASKGKPAEGDREIGLIYLQKGIRWIPDYRIELLDAAKARVSLQATVINEIADLADAHVRLVVGVPSFLMENALSPMALREASPQLSSFFAAPSRTGRGPGVALRNTMMSQVVRPSERRDEGRAEAGPDIPAEGQREDLFLFDKPHVTLKKGERAVLKLLDLTAPFEDIYTWDIPALPPRELWRQIGDAQQRQMADLLLSPRPMHKIRLTNLGTTPWTTGPAAIVKGGALLGQQLLTYTSAKGRVDVGITVATDINAKKEESEVRREPNVVINGDPYTKVSLHGTLTLTNFKDRPVRVVVTRSCFGAATAATADGRISQTNVIEDASREDVGPSPWAWLDWPWWWHRANPMSRITWEATIPAGKTITLEYDWQYFHR